VSGGTAIETQGQRKSYGDIVALRDVDLRVEAGTILGLLGPKGATLRACIKGRAGPNA
jgi:ABC-2 type transport system ATP-binding protein